ncbi:MAG: UDP-N-acetylmuramate dehydrogenase [Phormidesmis sp.]
MADTVQLTDGFKLVAQAPLAKLTTLRVGGKAEWLALPKTSDQLQSALSWAKSKGLAVTMLGAGSNLLISDRGLPGLTVCMRALRHSSFDAQTGRVVAAAGEPWSSLAWKAARHGLKGFEWTIGIPGTVGGAVVMNAGAHGGETADILIETKVADPDGAVSVLHPEDLGFRYRTSNLQGSDRTVISATFQLSPGHDPAKIKTATASDLRSRRQTQPYHLPNCGSVFRNPVPHSAGKLIQTAGLKGHQIGKAQVSTLHANFIVNLGGATASDVLSLIRHIQTVVCDRDGIQLETEVKILGKFDFDCAQPPSPL